MTFRILYNSTTADASDVNDNFYHVGQGSRLPMGGTGLANTDLAYDLGSSTYKWNNLFCNNIVASSSSYDNSPNIVSDIITASFTSRIEVSGFETYENNNMIIFYKTHNTTAYTGTSFNLNFNNDTTSTFEFSTLQGFSTAATGFTSYYSAIDIPYFDSLSAANGWGIIKFNFSKNNCLIISVFQARGGGERFVDQLRCGIYSYCRSSYATITSITFSSVPESRIIMVKQ